MLQKLGAGFLLHGPLTHPCPCTKQWGSYSLPLLLHGCPTFSLSCGEHIASYMCSICCLVFPACARSFVSLEWLNLFIGDAHSPQDTKGSKIPQQDATSVWNFFLPCPMALKKKCAWSIIDAYSPLFLSLILVKVQYISWKWKPLEAVINR